MRLMSFSLTEQQYRDGSKDVTRRLGWKFLKVGDRVQAVRKAMGLKRGEHPVKLGVFEVVSVRREQLDTITAEDVVREGFPKLTPREFVVMFCNEMGCCWWTEVTRIEFRRLK
jgi:hypothetical protein